MVYLKITPLESLKTYSAPITSGLQKPVLERNRENSPATLPSGLHSRGIAETVSTNHPALSISYSESFQRYTLLSYIPRCPWRMIIAVDCSQFLRGYKAVVQNMLDYPLWP
jgi:hypothetical protein